MTVDRSDDLILSRRPAHSIFPARLVPALPIPFHAALAAMVQKRSQVFPKSLMAELIEDQCAEAFEFVSRDREFGQVQYSLHASLDQIDDVPSVRHGIISQA